MDPDDPIFRTPDKAVCPAHTEDEALAAFIAEHASLTYCDYCDVEGNEPIAVPLIELVEVITEAIGRYYGHADDEGLPYISAEGGYQLGHPLTTYELLSTESELAASPDNELLYDLSAAIGGDAWIQRDFYRLAPLQRLTVGWYVFTQTVKYRNRFFFNQAVAEAAVDDDDTVEPIELLELIGNAASAHGMVGSVEPGTELLRARVHRADEHPSSAAELGSPPRHRAGANRMSPAGISMFYGALEAETAAAEAASAAAPGRDTVTTGRFVAVRALKVIDLRAMPPIPSPFALEFSASERNAIAFLHRFARDVALSIDRDGAEHIDYVPTQVVCEYLRLAFRDSDGHPLDGMIYPSRQREGGTNVVVFVDENGARDPEGSPARAAADAEHEEDLFGHRPRDDAILELREAVRAPLACGAPSS